MLSHGAANRLDSFQLPCGQCRGCRWESAQQWAVRCMHEAQTADTASFLTLTYSDEHLPDDRGVHVSHLQAFMKALRHSYPCGKCGQAPGRRHGKSPCGPFVPCTRPRFFACGEYGERTLRPHYHLALFNESFDDDRELHKVNARGDRLYTSKRLDRLWGKGHALIGSLSFESAAYIARYVCKKINGKKAEQEDPRTGLKPYQRVDTSTGEVFDVTPPFVTMSRKPGIGATWFDRYVDDVYPEDEVVLQGRRFRPPRFYDNKLDTEVLDRLKEKRRERVADRQHELTEDRLLVREQVLEEKMRFFEADL